MNIKYISAFLTLYREQNISRAATLLYITQQGLSRQVSAMETELGVKLFERERQGVVPTKICTELYPCFERIHVAYADAIKMIEEQSRTDSSSITVAFAQGLSNSDRADFIFEYQSIHPEISIEIREWPQSVCMEKLIEKKVDIAFLVTPIDEQRVDVRYEKEGYMYAAMHKSNPLAKVEGDIEFSLLDGENIITGAPENALRQMFDYFCLIDNIHPHIIVSSNFSVNYANAMQENMGIATVSAPMARRIQNPDIALRRLLTPEKGKFYCCSTKNTVLKKEVLELLNFVKLYFGGNPLEYILSDDEISSR